MKAFPDDPEQLLYFYRGGNLTTAQNMIFKTQNQTPHKSVQCCLHVMMTNHRLDIQLIFTSPPITALTGTKQLRTLQLEPSHRVVQSKHNQRLSQRQCCFSTQIVDIYSQAR